MSSSWNWTASKPEFLVGLELAGVLHLLADRRAERVGPGADVPGAEREPVLVGVCVRAVRASGRLTSGRWGVSPLTELADERAESPSEIPEAGGPLND